MKNDTTKIQTLNKIAFNFTYGKDKDQYSIYTKEAIALSEKIGYWDGIIESYSVESNYYDRIGKTKKAIQTIQKMVDFAKEKDDDRILGLAYLHLGEIYSYYPKENGKALENFDKALALFKKTKDKPNIKLTFLNLGLFNLDMKNYSEALKNYQDYLKENPTESQKSNVYLGIGTIFSKQEKYKDAVKNFEKAVVCLEKSHATNQIFFAHVVELLADNYVKVADYHNALITYNKAEKNFKKESLFRLIILQAKKSNLYFKTNETSKAKKHINEAISLVEKLNNCMQKNAFLYLYR